MRGFLVLVVVVGLVGCASAPRITAATPRSVTVGGLAIGSGSNQQAADLAQRECQKHGRHASLYRVTGTRLEGEWQFDCIN